MGVADTMTVDLSLMDEVFEGYEGQQGSLIPILQKAQDIYNFLPPDVLQAISDQLEISLGRVYGVATFYAQFYLEPRGKHVLKLCNGTACHVKGAPGLISAIGEEFGISPDETTPDGELTLEIVYCLGSCALAPAVVLDGQVIGNMRRETLLERVKKHIG